MTNNKESAEFLVRVFSALEEKTDLKEWQSEDQPKECPPQGVPHWSRFFIVLKTECDEHSRTKARLILSVTPESLTPNRRWGLPDRWWGFLEIRHTIWQEDRPCHNGARIELCMRNRGSNGIPEDVIAETASVSVLVLQEILAPKELDEKSEFENILQEVLPSSSND